MIFDQPSSGPAAERIVAIALYDTLLSEGRSAPITVHPTGHPTSTSQLEPPATRLLAQLLHTLNQDPTSPAIESLDQAAWQVIARSAAQQTLSPYLYYRLKRASLAPQVPAGVLEDLRGDMLISTRLRLDLERELSTLLAAFQDAGLEVIPLKGAHLSALVYPDPALRPVDDIDLLVRSDHLGGRLSDRTSDRLLAADRVLTGLGYGPPRGNWITDGYTSAHQHLPPYTRPNSYPVEVHWTLAHPDLPVHIPTAGLWDRALPAEIYGTTLQVLSTPDLLLHLCLHACQMDLFRGGLRPLVDVSELLHRAGAELDWQVLLQRAAQSRLTKCLYLVLHLVDELLGCSPPHGVLDSLRPLGVTPAILASARQSVLRSEGISPHFSLLWGSASLGQKSATLLQRIFLPPGEMYRRYAVQPGSLRYYLAYLARLKELSLRYAATGWRIWRGESGHAAASQDTNLLSEWLQEA